MSSQQQWKSQISFLISALGSAVGLGNIWRFSYMAYSHGGGTFVFAYVISLLCIGIPLLILEFGTGHYFKKSPPRIFSKIVGSEWVGWMGVLLSFVLITFYPIILSWCLLFFFYSFNLSWGSNTESFFYKDFLHLSEGAFHLNGIQGEIFIATVGIWILTWIILMRGVSGLEIANKICMPLLFIFISILVTWSLFLEGSSHGIASYFQFDFYRLWDGGLWLDAVGQVFFSLSLGYGVMMVYASYLDGKSDITKAAIITGSLDSGFAIFAGAGVFAVLGFMSTQSGLPLEEVAQQGPGLAFIVYTEALNIMASSMGESFAKIFGMIFFACLFLAGLSSLIALVETYVSAWIEKYNISRNKGLFLGVFVGFLSNIIFTTHAGFYWLDIVDHFIVSYGILITCVLECLLIGWVFKVDKLRTYVNSISRIQIGGWWNLLIKLIIPTFLLGNIVNALYKESQENYGAYPTNVLLFIGLGSILIFLLVTWMFSRKIQEHL